MNNLDFENDFIAQAEQAFNSVKSIENATPEQIATAREIVRKYELCINDLVFKLFSLVAVSPAKEEKDRELAHWQGMIDAYTGILLEYYTAKKTVEGVE
jgi:hypothetical protein